MADVELDEGVNALLVSAHDLAGNGVETTGSPAARYSLSLIGFTAWVRRLTRKGINPKSKPLAKPGSPA